MIAKNGQTYARLAGKGRVEFVNIPMDLSEFCKAVKKRLNKNAPTPPGDGQNDIAAMKWADADWQLSSNRHSLFLSDEFEEMGRRVAADPGSTRPPAILMVASPCKQLIEEISFCAPIISVKGKTGKMNAWEFGVRYYIRHRMWQRDADWRLESSFGAR